MKISDLLALELGESVSVANEPFTKMGQAEITLDDGTKMFWLFDDEDHLMSVAPKEDELFIFQEITEEIEPSETILFQNKEYEFSYEDSGKVKQVEGDTLVEEEDRYAFSDYQSKDGETIRLITNENSGEVLGYSGHTVSEDDLLEI
ncbi:MAG: DUF4178 domain-containing protein [Patescibacteria group bacterium]